jgi:hypothetical protein
VFYSLNMRKESEAEEEKNTMKEENKEETEKRK